MKKIDSLKNLLKIKTDRDLIISGNNLSDEEIEVKELCENSFLLFVEKAWPIIEGNAPFIYGWHIQAICEHLESLFHLDINRLIINLPPRLGKSNICSVLFPAWAWINDPHSRFLYSSYAQVLSVRDSVKCRRLIQSNWYQRLWGSKFQLMGDVNNKLRFDNNKTGYRIASSVGGSNTGEGGHYEICFISGTDIETDHGTIKIEKIVEEKLNVKVLSFNHETNETEFKPILSYMSSEAEEIMEIEFEDGTNLKCTPNHPIYVDGKGYLSAQSIQEDDCVLIL